MPKRILIIGIFYSLLGSLAFWGMFSELFKSQIYFNFTVLLLPIGIGLFKAEKWAQWWARFTIIIGYIVCAIAAAIVISSPENSRVYWNGGEIIGADAAPYLLTAILLGVIILASIHWFLYSEKAEYFFDGLDLQTIKRIV